MSATSRSIADLISNRGHIAANAEREQAGIAANARRDSAQIWGTTIAQIGQQIGNLPTQMAHAKTAQLEQQTKQVQMAALQRSIQAQDRANKTLSQMPRNEDGTYDTAALIQGLAQQNVPLDVTERLAKSIDGVNGVISSFNQSKNEHIADLANMILSGHQKGEPITADAVHLGIAAARSAGLATQADEKKFTELLGSGADPESLLKNVRSVGSKYKDSNKVVSVAPGASLVKESTGEALFTAQPRPTAPTPASIAMDAAKGDPSKALELLNADKTADNARADTQAANTAAYQRDMVRIAQLNAESNRIRATKPAAGTAGPKPRNVTSGDANRLAEITTGLNDLGQLQNKIGTTGPGSQLAAEWVPNWMTAWTGLGADSKSRQAVIDTIKQIIGKSLEGGVLRKEDEIKYEKILPRIGDAPAVAASKIGGLKETLGQKREDLMSALDDAGYDTSRFRARAGSAIAAPSMRYNPATGKVEPIK